MNASELFKAGRLSEAIDLQIKEVKANPADKGRRIFLFELLAFAGDLDRARRQIEAVSYEEAELEATVATYRALLESEQARRRTFEQAVKPEFLIDPPYHIRLRIDAAINYLTDDNDLAGSSKLLASAQTASSKCTVMLDGKIYEDFHDADDLFGPTLEVMTKGHYYWLALEQVESLAINPPKFPRDMLWVPARLKVKDGPEGRSSCRPSIRGRGATPTTRSSSGARPTGGPSTTARSAASARRSSSPARRAAPSSNGESCRSWPSSEASGPPPPDREP